MKNKSYTFFYHYNKIHKCLSLHYKGVCYMVSGIDCQVRSYSKFNKTQPHVVFVGKATLVQFDENNKATIR